MNYYEEQRQNAKALGFDRVIPINTDTYPQESFDKLWEEVSKADYAFEDTTRGNKLLFIENMLKPGTYNFEIPGEAFGQLTNAGPGTNAMIHFVTMGTNPTSHLVDAATEIFRFGFDKISVHRITAFIPSFNQRVIRMAALLRMKFEGQLRKTFLYEESWWDVHIYGLLESEWRRRD